MNALTDTDLAATNPREQESGDAAEEMQLVSFKLSNEEYGVDIMQVQEIIRLSTITHVPRAPRFVEGVIDLRGEVLPIIDLRRRFGLPPAERTAAARIVVAHICDTNVGLIVDAVSEVLRLPRKAFVAAPAVVAGVDSRFLKGIGRLGNRLIILLDLDSVLTADEIEELSTTEVDDADPAASDEGRKEGPADGGEAAPPGGPDNGPGEADKQAGRPGKDGKDEKSRKDDKGDKGDKGDGKGRERPAGK